ncbi:DUF1961 family protein [Limibacter armeniacum]|uniref:DUF1961 family protein n=1 Tax=Limibacter armeniacum TaxID=466084 RepID=UPI002FE62263
MKKILVLVLSVICISASLAQTPLFEYKVKPFHEQEDSEIHGEARIVELSGKKAYNLTSIHSRLVFPKHTLNEEKGSLNLWFFPLEDLSPAYRGYRMDMNNKYYFSFSLLSDYAQNPNNIDEANFALSFARDWHPQFYAKFYKGTLFPTRVDPPQKGFVTSEHFLFEKNRWYQITLTWDKKKNELRLYANGILIGTEDSTNSGFYYDQINDQLYVNNNALALGDYSFYEEVLSPKKISALYKTNLPDFDAQYHQHLLDVFAGGKIEDFEFGINEEWQEKLNLSLKEPQHLDLFHVQGYTDAPSITEEGLLIETPFLDQCAATLDSQVYVWSKDIFEGDLYVEYEFKSLRPGGLSLLMVQAAGMQREDVLKDYPLRTNGNFRTAIGEDVRNYHWEYYREMNDVRNDIASGGLTKNPYYLPLDYGTFDKPFENYKWHKLQFLQQGNKLVGAIDGKIIVEAEDSYLTNSGGVYNFGHIVIRCMVRTKLLVRNLKVYNRNTEVKVIESKSM